MINYHVRWNETNDNVRHGKYSIRRVRLQLLSAETQAAVQRLYRCGGITTTSRLPPFDTIAVTQAFENVGTISAQWHTNLSTIYLFLCSFSPPPLKPPLRSPHAGV